MPESLSCRVDVAAVRAEPDAAAEQVTQLLRGEPVKVVERAGRWARVTTAYDYPGWVDAATLSEATADGWLPPLRDGDPVTEAQAFLGAPYLWGGMTAGGIDCSGLVHMAWRRLGRLVPRDAADQEAAGIPLTSPSEGDLATYGVERATHIAFWLDTGRILHASSSRGVVEESEPRELIRIRRGFVRLRPNSIEVPRSS